MMHPHLKKFLCSCIFATLLLGLNGLALAEDWRNLKDDMSIRIVSTNGPMVDVEQRCDMEPRKGVHTDKSNIWCFVRESFHRLDCSTGACSDSDKQPVTIQTPIPHDIPNRKQETITLSVDCTPGQTRIKINKAEYFDMDTGQPAGRFLYSNSQWHALDFWNRSGCGMDYADTARLACTLKK